LLVSSRLTKLLEDLRTFHKTRQESLLKSADAYKTTNQSLDKLRVEIKSMVKSLESDAASRLKSSKTELDSLHGRSKHLNDAIVDVRSGSGAPKHDPCMLKITMEKAMEIAKGKQIKREKSVENMKLEVSAFEKKIIESLKVVLGELPKRNSESMKALGEALGQTLASIDPRGEERLFMDAQRSISREESIPSFDYGMDDPLTRVVKSAGVKRQKAIIKSSFTDCFVLLVYLKTLT
jgi:DNA mismatch repair ATPase MutS